MKRDNKEKFPKWRKTSPGTLVLRKPSAQRIKPKQIVICLVGDLGRFAISDFELLEEGKGEFKVTDKIIKASVKKAEDAMIRSGSTRRYREVTKLKDLAKGPVVGENQDPTGDEKYKVKHKGGGRFVVLSPAKKQMHGGTLNKEDAKALKKQLEG